MFTHFLRFLVQQRLFTGDVNDQEVSHMANEELAEYDILTEEFKYVERLIPPTTVPPVPPHNSYPTSSGWMPPTGRFRDILSFLNILSVYAMKL